MTLQALRGMPDILPMDSRSWHQLETLLVEQAHRWGYAAIRTPLLEPTSLFSRSMGEGTDILDKEMYTFSDRNDESVSLRPEGTAGCVRALLQHHLLRAHAMLRCYYLGPMFRYERPQRGRFRQFWQFGMECFHAPAVWAEVELLQWVHGTLKILGCEQVRLLVNYLGSQETQQRYQKALVDYLSAHVNALDADSQRRLHTNPLRILDAKVEETQAILAQAPALMEYWSEEESTIFHEICQMLSSLGIAYHHDNRLVRGLDYYDGFVFEWVSDALGAQGTICAGGRYDRLTQALGNDTSIPAVGFACGLERLLMLSQRVHEQPARKIYVVLDEQTPRALEWVERLRAQLPQYEITMDLQGGRFGQQFKRADKQQADYVLILGEEEWKIQKFSLKTMSNAKQERLSKEELITYLEQQYA